MSGMFDAKPDKAKRKIERSIKEKRAKKKSKNITIIVMVVFILLFITAMILNSGWIRRTLPVVTIEGVSFTTAEFEYFFNSQYMEYMNMLQQFQGMGGSGPDQSRPLASQIYNRETGETWADIISSFAYQRMQTLVGLYNAASEYGFELNEEHHERIRNELLMVELEAAVYDLPSADNLLQRMYGNSLNMNAFKKLMEFIATAEEYSEHIRKSFTYTDDQLDEFYAENADDLDIITYRVLTVTGDLPDQSEENYEEKLAEAVAEAQALARNIAAGITTEDEFITAALEYNENIFSNPNSTIREVQGERIEELYSAWLLNSSIRYGDVEVFDTERGAAILMFVSRNDNNYQIASMRQIVVIPETVSPEDYPDGENDPGYILALNEARINAEARAQHLYELFEAAGSTEEAMLELIEEHSEDDTTEGILFDMISKFPYQGADFRVVKVVPEVEEWLFEEERKSVDSKLIESELQGFHIVYFVEYGKVFSHIIAEDRMRTAAHNDFLDSLTVGEPVKHIAFFLVSM